MKKVSFVIMLVLTTMAGLAQTPSTQNQPASSKVIKDPAEYDAYMAALRAQDPAQKAAGMEAFLKQYPSSIMRSDALDQLLDAYTAGGNAQKMEETAGRILKESPENIRALVVETQIQRAKATPDSAAAAGAYAQNGLQLLPAWSKPEGIADADFEKAKSQI